MLTRRTLLCALLTVCLNFASAHAQAPASAQTGRATVVVSASAERVRFAAPNRVARLKLEVLTGEGELVFEAGSRGSVFDWTLADSQGARLADGTYLCVVTVKDVAGRLSQSLALVEVAGGRVSARPAAASDLTPGQAREVGPVEGEAASVAGGDEAPAATLTTHDGRDGAVTSTAGDLTLRTGDFFAGKDTERVRVTADGRVGIGTDKPEATLDVAGDIHARGGIRFADGTTLRSAAGAPFRRIDSASDTVPGPSAAGTGTVNRLAKWAETGGAGTLTDSTFQEDASGNVFNFFGTRVAVGGQQPFFEAQRNSTSDILQRFWNTGAGGAKLRYVAGTGATSQIQLTDNTEWLSSIAGNNSIGLQFRVRAVGSTNSEAGLDSSAVMTLSRNGNVGVGTTAPSAKLDVAGSIKVTGAGNGITFPDGTRQTTAAATAGSSNFVQLNPASQQAGGFNVNGDGAVGGTLSANAVTTSTVNGLSKISGTSSDLLAIERRVNALNEFRVSSAFYSNGVDNYSGGSPELLLGALNSSRVRIGGVGTSGNGSFDTIRLTGHTAVVGILTGTGGVLTGGIDTQSSNALSIGSFNATAINLLKPTNVSGLLTASNGLSANTANISGDITVGGTINGTAANANNAANLGGVAAGEYVQTSDARLSDARNPLPGSGSYIQTNPAEQQNGGFNISGSGSLGGSLTAGAVNFIGLRTQATASAPNVIGGHSLNAVTTNVVGATIGGGGNPIHAIFTNRVTDSYGAVGGGEANTAGNDDTTVDNVPHATVGGGFENRAGGGASTVGGGRSNSASGEDSTVGGGFANTAGGFASTVPGGLNNQALGQYSFAAGQRAKAEHQGSFVWSDATASSHFTSTAANQFLINAAGGVGIGTNSPGANLHVSGAGIVRARVNSDGNAGLALTLNNQPGWSVATVTGGHFQIFNDAVGQNAVWVDAASNNVGIGTISTSHKLHVNGTVAGVGPYVNASDARFKRDIRPIPGALSKVLALRGVTYDWRREEFPSLNFSVGRQVGFVAQEVELVVPEAVVRDSAGFRSVAYSHLAPVLVEAVKEQQAQIERQQEQLKRQQSKIEQQRRQLDGLRRLVCREHPEAEVCKL